MVGSPERNTEEFGLLPGSHVGDFGSGAGHYTLPLSRLVGDKGRVYAVDINESSLVRLKNLSLSLGARNINMVLGSVEVEGGTLLRDGFLDGIVFSNLLFHLENRPAAVREAWRVLAPGGRLFLIEWSDQTPLMLTREKTKRDLVSRKKAESLFLNAGFHMEREFDAGEHHFGLILKKPGV